MGQRPGLRRRAAVLSAILFAALVAAPGMAASPTVADRGQQGAAALPAQTTADLARSLMLDGRFRGAAGVEGTVNTAAWRLVSNLAAGEAPRFAAVRPNVATPIGPWSALGSNGAGDGALNSHVEVVVVDGTSVYIGGTFTNVAGLATADYVAKWNGSVWSGLGSNGFDDGAIAAVVDAIAVSGSTVYVGGNFVNAAGILTADYVAKFSANSWSALGSNGVGIGALNSRVNAATLIGSDLYVGGTFTNAAGIPEADRVAKWNGSAWLALGSNGAGNGAILGSDYVFALAVSGSTLYVGGVFANVANIAEADYVAKWNGSAWSALGSNGTGNGAINQVVYALGTSGTDLYVGGGFTDVVGILSADYAVKWNGSTWAPLGSNGAGNGALNGVVYRIGIAGTVVYVGGSFTNVAGVPEADYVSRWDGGSWTALGSNGNGEGAVNNYGYCCSMAASSTDLYVGGQFTNIGGIPTADYIAKWSLAPFTDIAGSQFESDIVWVYLQGIASGCSATLYCPLASVTRAQMATFLARALNLPPTGTDFFTDDNGSIYESSINRVAAAGITTGCTPTTFCPNANVTRGQMAAFLARALSLPGTATDFFTDDTGSIYESSINRVAAAGITSGCTPTTYCPNANVSRGQMAAFLHRAFGP
jgi:hypothetical protein